jgi:hypothetical protein
MYGMQDVRTTPLGSGSSHLIKINRDVIFINYPVNFIDGDLLSTFASSIKVISPQEMKFPRRETLGFCSW